MTDKAVTAAVEQGYVNWRCLAQLLVDCDISFMPYLYPENNELQLKDDSVYPKWSVIFRPGISGGWQFGLLEYLDCDTNEEQGFLSPLEALELIKKKVGKQCL